jgi:hypothetical protein
VAHSPWVPQRTLETAVEEGKAIGQTFLSV